ncbi:MULTISPECIES: LacI family DNA-binding transcriptional regulator [Aminobacter]|jgi:LacI family transcriptional regulator|uniref:LacI family transcriptional regulator n=1 Tax=Aminobacter aminovorans TaxID=83263 RepID=A0AAC8YQE3_AMIAI|nr:LacI family DNA-binding transcriptional regulator [Aminobacter aminovorans]AMS42294.1 Transcriptional regulator LacI family [Aminobacter aminovorans]MBB3709115.1 LacI family transcriptional regulator [Aminobacter aminovorans]
MRPTARDLAEAAGVSLATVDRVLNERPNVSPKAARSVAEAIERIGFMRNPAAVALARNKTYRFRFVLPTSGDQYLAELIARAGEATEALRADSTDVEAVQIAMSDPHHVAKYLTAIDHETVDGVAVMAPESPQVRDAMLRLVERGVRVVQFLSGQERLESADYVGVDNFAAGATAGKITGRFLCERPGKIMVVAETMMALDSIQRRLGFDSIINAQFPHLESLPSLETYGDEKRADLIIRRTLEHNPDTVAVYVLSSEARIPLTAVWNTQGARALTVVAHERTPFSEQALMDERIDAVIAQDPGHAVRSALRILRARSDHREPLASQERIRIEVLLKENLQFD